MHVFYEGRNLRRKRARKENGDYIKVLNILNPDMASVLISNCNFSNNDFYKMKKYFGQFYPGVSSTPHDYKYSDLIRTDKWNSLKGILDSLDNRTINNQN